jgi:Fur family ferric uptake transcriptional regulator
MRSTRQRGSILRTLEEADRPLSAVEILHLARSIVPGLGLATVYRTVDAMVGSGALTAVDIPGKPPRYEVAGKDHHHHFLCKSCHKVFAVHGCPGHLDAHVPRGFVLEGHEITLFGRCDACATGPVARSTRPSLRAGQRPAVPLTPVRKSSTRSKRGRSGQ